MRYSIKRGADDTIQLVLEAQNDEEDGVLRDLYVNGRIMGLGETKGERAELLLATSPPDHRMRGINGSLTTYRE